LHIFNFLNFIIKSDQLCPSYGKNTVYQNNATDYRFMLDSH
jgi:hypothetical protein